MRRQFLKQLATVPLALASIDRLSASSDRATPLRLGVTPVFLVQRAQLLERWRGYLGASIGRPVEFVLRGSYREITTLLLSGRVDAAWICEYPFVRHDDDLRLLAAPVYQGEPNYRAYLIVPREDHSTEWIEDLSGKLFAFSDPDSLSGYKLPRYWLRESGRDPDRFFERSILTWSHRNSIQAVADRLVDGASVDGYVWDMLDRISPEITARTRVVLRSQPYGFPPIVTPKSLSLREADRLREACLAMADDPDGQEILAALGLDGFASVESSLYDDVRLIADVMEA